MLKKKYLENKYVNKFFRILGLGFFAALSIFIILGLLQLLIILIIVLASFYLLWQFRPVRTLVYNYLYKYYQNNQNENQSEEQFNKSSRDISDDSKIIK